MTQYQPAIHIDPPADYSQISVGELESKGLWNPHILEAAACKAYTRMMLFLKLSRRMKIAKIRNYPSHHEA